MLPSPSPQRKSAERGYSFDDDVRKGWFTPLVFLYKYPQ